MIGDDLWAFCEVDARVRDARATALLSREPDGSMLVFVSEYDFSLGECIWSSAATLKVSGGTGQERTERLYLVTDLPEAERYRRPPVHLMLMDE